MYVVLLLINLTWFILFVGGFYQKMLLVASFLIKSLKFLSLLNEPNVMDW